MTAKSKSAMFREYLTALEHSIMSTVNSKETVGQEILTSLVDSITKLGDGVLDFEKAFKAEVSDSDIVIWLAGCHLVTFGLIEPGRMRAITCHRVKCTFVGLADTSDFLMRTRVLREINAHGNNESQTIQLIYKLMLAQDQGFRYLSSIPIHDDIEIPRLLNAHLNYKVNEEFSVVDIFDGRKWLVIRRVSETRWEATSE